MRSSSSTTRCCRILLRCQCETSAAQSACYHRESVYPCRPLAIYFLSDPSGFLHSGDHNVIRLKQTAFLRSICLLESYNLLSKLDWVLRGLPRHPISSFDYIVYANYDSNHSRLKAQRMNCSHFILLAHFALFLCRHSWHKTGSFHLFLFVSYCFCYRSSMHSVAASCMLSS